MAGATSGLRNERGERLAALEMYDRELKIKPEEMGTTEEEPNFAPHGGLGVPRGAMEEVFPRISCAEPAAQEEILVKGRPLQLWNYKQLEFLNTAGLRQRVLELRDRLGAERCPPLPSMQRDDTIRWILHVQGNLTGKDMRFGYGAPRSVVREDARRPFKEVPPHEPQHGSQIPFGLGPGLPKVNKDHLEVYFDGPLVDRDDIAWRGEGIETLHPGGEGRRHIQPTDHMLNEGVADNLNGYAEEGIETLRHGGEGRRHIQPKDHFVNEGTVYRGPGYAGQEGIETVRPGGEGRKHIQPPAHMLAEGFAALDPGHHLVTDRIADVHVTGDRKRHIGVPDHMINVGTANRQPEKNEAEAGQMHGRRHVNYFTGPQLGGAGEREVYHPGHWKRDPSRLGGNSMIC